MASHKLTFKEVNMALWDKVVSGGLNQAQSTVSELCKLANMPVDQLVDNGGMINLIIQGTRKQHCYVELSSSHNLPLIFIYSPAAPLPVNDLPPAKVILDIMAKTHHDPFLKWTVYQSKAGDIILSCASANFLDFYKSHPDIFSYYVKTVAVMADEVEKMTGKDTY
jgi:hypothetical protein